MKKSLILLFIICSCLSLNAQENQALELDSDNDLINDKYDKCPNTPDGVCVDKDGCTQKIKRVVSFNSASYSIDEKDIKKVENIVEIAKECFGYKILLKGHTDSTYLGNYNLTLSKQRVDSLKKLLIQNKIDKNRINIEWYGETSPISTNVTKEGRETNRRVEVIFK